MRIGTIGKDAAYPVGMGACQALLRQKKHVRDDKIDLWKNRKQAKQCPPEAEKGDEGIAGGARTQNLGKAIFTIEAVEIYDQGGFPAKDRAARRG
jgi:hypothetical protein